MRLLIEIHVQLTRFPPDTFSLWVVDDVDDTERPVQATVSLCMTNCAFETLADERVLDGLTSDW